MSCVCPRQSDGVLLFFRLKDCGITEEGFAALASALRSNPSHLIELDLSGNKVGDFGVQMLSSALEIPYCKLGTLK